MSFVRACEHIRNFSTGHESEARNIQDDKFEYPDNHIEADNRLSWFLGHLDKAYGNEAHYVVLKRDKELTVQSFNRRWAFKGSIIQAFGSGILMQRLKELKKKDLLQICGLYYDTIYENIELFLKDKDHILEIHLSNIKEDFKKFWNWIGAEGDLDAALAEFDIVHNQSKKKRWIFF